MGMALLAHLAAHDFGYLSTERLLTRLAASLDSMDGLERHRRHFYNWYDTQTLEPLRSAVCLHRRQRQPGGPVADLARRGLRGWQTPHVRPAVLKGLRDTLDILQQAQQAAGVDDQAVLELREKA